MAITIEARPFGLTHHAEPVTCWQLSSPSLRVELLDYGATIRALWVRDRDGQWRDVVLGYDTLREYESRDGYLGACVGRVCNRLGGAAFTLNGQRYSLARNDGPHHLHGGLRGFDKYVWQAESGPDFLRFSRTSPDGEEGYPGTLRVSLTYRLLGDGLELCYEAISDQDTLCSLTNHTYWNLEGGGTVLTHTLQLQADSFLENSGECLPTGQILPVAATPMDFRQPKPLGRDIGAADVQLLRCGGYDHNYCLSGDGALREAAVLRGPHSGITLRLLTTMPGLQLYTANALLPRAGKGGALYRQRDAVCLETQFYPNAMCCPGFVRPILPAGERYHQLTRYCFSVEPTGEELP